MRRFKQSFIGLCVVALFGVLLLASGAAEYLHAGVGVNSTGQAGTLDTSFGGGIVATPGEGSTVAFHSVAIDSKGRPVAVGDSQQRWVVARYLANGTLDASFGTGGLVHLFDPNSGTSAAHVAIDGNNNILVVGRIWGNPKLTVVRLTEDGELDDTFAGNGIAELEIGIVGGTKAVAIQQDGKIVVTGETAHKNQYRFLVVARYNEDGTLDTASFGNPNSSQDIRRGAPPYKGYIADGINPTKDDWAVERAIALQQDGKILVGHMDTLAPNPYWSIVRYTAHARDTSFATNGILSATTYGPFDRLYLRHIAVQANGKILASGNAMDDDFSPPKVDGVIVRYFENGELDTSFGYSGITRTNIPAHVYGNQVGIQTDGRIVLGCQIYWDGKGHFMTFRFDEGGMPDPSFGVEGQSELVSYPDATGNSPRGLAMDASGDIYQCGSLVYNNQLHLAIAKFLAGPTSSFLSPIGLVATPMSTEAINLTWTSRTIDEYGFEIERSPDGSDWALVHSTGPMVETWDNLGLQPNTTYYYRVRAFKGDLPEREYSTWSNIAIATTNALPPDPEVNVSTSSDKVKYTTADTAAILTVTVTDEFDEGIPSLDFSNFLVTGAPVTSFSPGIPGVYTITLNITGLGVGNHPIAIQVTDNRDPAIVGNDSIYIQIEDPPSVPTIFVSSIGYHMTGPHLNVTITVGSQPPGVDLSGVQVAITLLRNGANGINYLGTTGSSGTVTFTLNKAPSGSYTTTINSLAKGDWIYDSTENATDPGFTR